MFTTLPLTTTAASPPARYQPEMRCRASYKMYIQGEKDCGGRRRRMCKFHRTISLPVYSFNPLHAAAWFFDTFLICTSSSFAEVVRSPDDGHPVQLYFIDFDLAAPHRMISIEIEFLPVIINQASSPASNYYELVAMLAGRNLGNRQTARER